MGKKACRFNYTLSKNEADNLLRSKSEPYKMKGHVWKPLNRVGKSYCPCCGLVALNNAPTRWCIEKGCNYSDHPQYTNSMKRLMK